MFCCSFVMEIKFELLNFSVAIEHTNNVRYLYDDDAVVVQKDVSVGGWFVVFFMMEIKFEPMNICVVIEHTNNV